MSPRTSEKIAVVKLRTLGDILTTFPLLRALKELRPRARLVVVADEAYRELFTPNPRVDGYWGHPAAELKERGAVYAARHNAEFIRRLRAERFDWYLDLYGSMRTAGWGFWAGIPRRLGFNLRVRRWFYTDRIVAAYRYVVDLNLQFARRLGWQGEDNRLEFFLLPEDEAAAQRHLLDQGWDGRRPLLIVSPGGGWPVKCWPAERFGEVAKRLAADTGCQIVLSGTPAEREVIQACARALGGAYLEAVGLPLRQAAAVIRRGSLMIGNDSGPKYFAEAFGVPTLICYGPTDFINNNPEGPGRHVLYRDLPCRPCHSEVCRQERRACLDDLSADEVLQAARRLWAARPPAA